MTAKHSPLDFIINDSTARSDKQKAREYAATHGMPAHTEHDHRGRCLSWSSSYERDSYLNKSCSVMSGSEDLKRLAVRPDTRL